MLCSLSLWRTNSRGAVASSGPGDEQRHAQEQHCGPLHRRTACQHCEGKQPALGELSLRRVCVYLQGYFLNCLNFKLTFYLNNMLESCGWLVPITSFEKNGKERLQNKN